MHCKWREFYGNFMHIVTWDNCRLKLINVCCLPLTARTRLLRTDVLLISGLLNACLM